MIKFIKNWIERYRANKRMEAAYKKRVEDLKKKDPFIYK